MQSIASLQVAVIVSFLRTTVADLKEANALDHNRSSPQMDCCDSTSSFNESCIEKFGPAVQSTLIAGSSKEARTIWDCRESGCRRC